MALSKWQRAHGRREPAPVVAPEPEPEIEMTDEMVEFDLTGTPEPEPDPRVEIAQLVVEMLNNYKPRGERK